MFYGKSNWMIVLFSIFFSSVTFTDNLRLYGKLISDPCTILPGDESITLDINPVVDKYLYLNKRTLGKKLEINLIDCDVSTSKNVSISINGKEDAKLAGFLAVNSSEKLGVGLGFETFEGVNLPLNKLGNKIALKPKNNVIQLRVYVQAEESSIVEKKIGRGSFDATATFHLKYE